ncbi:holo-ACP synthase [Halorubrum pallidum]|uniref:Holo-ACP synthase n=1 Tax=Halorubrum pallidum TaxID=1526114 RepID=A0ABD5T4E4_9EURY
MTNTIDPRNADSTASLDELDSGVGWRVLSGTDIVSTERITALLDEFDRSFAERAFTPAERCYCDAQANPPQHYAARWAAKESFLKTLGEAVPKVPTTEIGVEREPTGPRLVLSNQASEALTDRLRAAGIDTSRADLSVCMSHDVTCDRALAHVVVVGPTVDASASRRAEPTAEQGGDS